ncbi:MAG: hypothetical protein NT140_11480 [Deltaproteobacteria bacterium]|nr:hypothetical protein [Deltaproteobacteria bacterium]
MKQTEKKPRKYTPKKLIVDDHKGRDSIDEYIRQKERASDVLKKFIDLTLVSMTLRMSVLNMAILDHLSDRWKISRTSIATDLLTDAINTVFYKLYSDKSDKELEILEENLIHNFMMYRRKDEENKK